MYADHSSESPIRRYFAGLAENTFQSDLGVVDPPLVDYLSDLLVRFVRSDIVHRIRSVTGRPLMNVGEMAKEAAERLGGAKRELHRHIGDFTLFWAGVYPEALQTVTTDEQYKHYLTHGKLSYRLAGEIEPANLDRPECEVLLRLSDRFELCAYGLREVRRAWEDGDGSDGDGGILLN